MDAFLRPSSHPSTAAKLGKVAAKTSAKVVAKPAANLVVGGPVPQWPKLNISGLTILPNG